MKRYIGEVHSHTTESDGKGGSPRDAYKYARDVGKVDYFAVTDHNVHLDEERFLSMMPPLADEMNEDGRFAALYGYEMSYGAATGYYGHLNVYGTKSVDGVSQSLGEWYSTLEKRSDAELGQFNHPGEKWGDFDEFAYNEAMDKIFELIELRIEEYGVPVIEEEYERCLAAGWHVGPVSNEDSHGADWTTVREETGAVLAEELTRENIIEAMHAHRTYATTDGSLKIFYTANGEWLGSTLAKTGRLNIRVEVSTAKECGIGILQAVGEQNTVLAEINVGNKKSFVWELSLKDDHRYVYIRRSCGTHYAVTAPVWVEQPHLVQISADHGYGEGGLCVRAVVENKQGLAIENAVAEFIYKSGRIYAERSDSVRKDIGTVEAFESAQVSVFADDCPECDKVTVVIKGECDGMPIRVAASLAVCPLVIPRIFVNTSKYSADRYYPQPFCCFDIYNTSAEPCELSGYVFRVYQGAGLLYKDIILDRVLEAGKTLTVWLRGRRMLDVDDFNQYFGTCLVECKDVVAVDIELDGKQHTRKILICKGNRTVRRAWIRYGDFRETPIPNGAATVYRHDRHRATENVEGIYRGHKPGDGYTRSLGVTDFSQASVCNATKQTRSERVVCICDGGIDRGELESLVNKALPNTELVRTVIGNNDGSERLDKYFRSAEGEGMLLWAANSSADTVAVCVGLNDCDKKREAWLKSNFLSLATLLECIVLYLEAAGKRVVLMCPEGDGRNTRLLRNAVRAVSGTLEISCSADKPDVAPAFVPVFKRADKPREGAIRIACLGDQYTSGMGGITPYPQKLVDMLGVNADIRVYAKEGMTAASADGFFALTYAAEELENMKQFKPDAIVMWLGMADVKIKNCKQWDAGYRESFVKGFEDIAATLRQTGARLYIVTPFCRQDSDVRREITVREGNGAADTVKALATELGAALIDLMSVTVNGGEYVEIGRANFQYLNEAGSEYLAREVCRLIENHFDITVKEG